MSLTKSNAYVESIDGFEQGLGGILIRLQGVCDVWKDDRIETPNGTMYHVESFEAVEDLFESYTLVWITVMLPSGPLPVKLDESLLHQTVSIHLSIERAAERLLWFGTPTKEMTKKYLWKGGTV